MGSRVRSLRLGLDVIAAALIGLYLLSIVARNIGAQWDFRTYWVAARAAWSGLDPYVPAHLEALARRPTEPFVYPPIALAFFLPIAAIPQPSAALLWILLQTLVLAGLVLLWMRTFVGRDALLPLAVLAVFGWNGSALWNLRSGNVALIECGLLWAGFAFFAAGRRTVFASLVVLASCFKLLPAAFLLLLLVPTERGAPSRRLLLASVAALAVLVGGSALLGQALHWEPFLRHLPDSQMLGESSPGSLALIRTMIGRTGLAEPQASRIATATWIAYAVALLASSAPALRRAWLARDTRRWVALAVFLQILLTPRLMAYGFVVLAPAPLLLAPRWFARPVGRLLLVLLLSTQGLFRAVSYQQDSLAAVFAPFLLTLLLWLWIANDSGTAPAAARDAEALAA